LGKEKKFVKVDLEKLLLVMLENLEVQKEQIRLLREQNELLVGYNHKLMRELAEMRVGSYTGIGS
jgi:hypothetical protein